MHKDPCYDSIGFVVRNSTFIEESEAHVLGPPDDPLVGQVAREGWACGDTTQCYATGPANMAQPWLEEGYRAITVDIQDSPTTNPARQHFVADVAPSVARGR